MDIGGELLNATMVLWHFSICRFVNGVSSMFARRTVASKDTNRQPLRRVEEEVLLGGCQKNIFTSAPTNIVASMQAASRCGAGC